MFDIKQVGYDLLDNRSDRLGPVSLFVEMKHSFQNFGISCCKVNTVADARSKYIKGKGD